MVAISNTDYSNTNNVVTQASILNDNPLDDPLLADPDAVPTKPEADLGLGPELQSQLAAHIIHDPDVLSQASQILDHKAFASKALQIVVQRACEYYRDYGKMPPRLLLDALCADAVKGNKAATTMMDEIKSLQHLTVNTKEYWLDQMRRLCQNLAIRRSFSQVLQDSDYGEFFKSIRAAEAIGTSSLGYDLYDDEEIDHLDGVLWQVADHFPKKGTIVVFGPSGSGKSFYCLDLAYSVATGLPFLKKFETIKGNVLYIYSEGAYGLKGRRRAWKAAHGVAGKVAGIAFSTCSHDLQNKAEVELLISKAKTKLGQIDLVFVDTLSRNFGGGDADKNADMQAYLRNVDFIREQTGATVVNIHHTGWSETSRERGAKSLRDYSDASISVQRVEDMIEVSCKKQKDKPEFETYFLNKVQHDDSLYLAFEGSKAALTKADQEAAEADQFAKLLEAIPDLPIDADVTEVNTITPATLESQLGLSRAEINKRLLKLCNQGLVQRERFGDSRSPYCYWRSNCLVH